MDSRTRLAKAFDGEMPDRPPIIGGWLAAPNHIQMLTGCSDDDFWNDQYRWSIQAEHVLGTDGILVIMVPMNRCHSVD